MHGSHMFPMQINESKDEEKKQRKKNKEAIQSRRGYAQKLGGGAEQKGLFLSIRARHQAGLGRGCSGQRSCSAAPPSKQRFFILL